MERDLFSLQAYQYDLPEELIVQHPSVPRDQSRLLVIDRKRGSMEEIRFRELENFLGKGDSLVFNDTKVIPARLIGQRSQNGKAEILLVKRLAIDTWEALAKPGKKLGIGASIVFGDSLRCEVVDTLAGGNKIIRFEWETTFEEALARYGRLPLPPYITRSEKQESDETRYQTVYADRPGAIAAPTAGLHFTEEMLSALKSRGVSLHKVTLHVGLGTFKPVQADDIRDHIMHAEECIITSETARELNDRDPDKLQICVGTTTLRTLESAADPSGMIVPGRHETDIFIYPGYTCKYVRSLLTNFHLPGSTLLMLLSAFAGYDLIREAYAKAVKDRFRFYSYGDAMLII